ncbi:methyltransferase domain-containing protein [Tunturibacter empetritectus]|uniref:Methyltransferase domain-containing protein n=1 Tax=Tunturiibacter empetritectus TaxID=3069691 RepID=A0AAU7Z860_9BACT
MRAAEFETKTENEHAFAAWAKVYDEQPNPLLALEERYFAHLLPHTKDRDVLDVGCGSGRWLSRFVHGGPATLHGLDSSSEMIEIAARKELSGAELIHAALPLIPIASGSKDLVLASFVLSYVEDLELCASELARVIRPGGDLFLSDMHPGTAATLGWKRGFDTPVQTYRLKVHTRPLIDLISTFVAHGFAIVVCLEPPFDESEHELFMAAGKETAWQQAAGKPAICLLHFRRMSVSSPAIRESEGLHLRGAQCVLGAHESLAASITVDSGLIASIATETARSANRLKNRVNQIDLTGYLVFPGLVNAHDHLEFALFPRLGSPPYENATEWALDIQVKEAEKIALHKRVPKDVRLWWGSIRNLLCGVTTVCQHNPVDPVLMMRDFPIRVITNYGWDHSLAFAKDIRSALEGTPANAPFLIHACEGVDHVAAKELYTLDAVGAIEERTVLIHGLSLDAKGAALLNERRSALVICPSSNSFLFEKTLTRELLHSIKRLGLGSDSPLTSNGDLLDEIRFARWACDLNDDRLFSMVTEEAAQLLRLHGGEGSLRGGAVADLIAVTQRVGSPAHILSELSWRDVELVIVGGLVHLASSEIFDRLTVQMRRTLVPLMVEKEVRWLRAPATSLLDATENVLGDGNVRVGGLHVSRMQA